MFSEARERKRFYILRIQNPRSILYGYVEEMVMIMIYVVGDFGSNDGRRKGTMEEEENGSARLCLLFLAATAHNIKRVGVSLSDGRNRPQTS